jgi:hypothetical protein
MPQGDSKATVPELLTCLGEWARLSGLEGIIAKILSITRPARAGNS